MNSHRYALSHGEARDVGERSHDVSFCTPSRARYPVERTKSPVETAAARCLEEAAKSPDYMEESPSAAVDLNWLSQYTKTPRRRAFVVGFRDRRSLESQVMTRAEFRRQIGFI